MKNVILHVGHGKTGSSYLQSIFALNTDLLLNAGILYPDHRSLAKAAKGLITSGNQGALSEEVIENADQNTVFFSGERLFNSLANGRILNGLVSKFNVKVILYTRNVIDIAISRWAQEVKRSGEIKDVDSFLSSESIGSYARVVDWIEMSKSLNFELILRNYSLHQDDLAKDFFENSFSEKIKYSDLKLPESKKVNRSLTQSENEIQRVFNHIVGEKSSSYISDFVINKFPDLEPASIKISKNTYDAIVSKNSESLDVINDFISPDEKVTFGSTEEFVSNKEEKNSLPTEVIASIGESIKNNFLLDSAEPKETEAGIKGRDNLVKLLRVTAIKIEKGAKLDLSDALALMKAAQELRPNGAVINQKVEEWSEKLASEESVEA